MARFGLLFALVASNLALSVYASPVDSKALVLRQDGGDVQQPPAAPAGFQTGWSSQDTEPAGQQSACTEVGSCPNNVLQIADTSSTTVQGVYAAAVNPADFGGDQCVLCGQCYTIQSSGQPSPAGPGGPPNQPTGTITVQIVNQCTNCAPGQFDIVNAPAGWNNPLVYYQGPVPC